jgi:hypothetical protein
MITKPVRRFVAQFAILAMVFSQFAMTAYACPVQGPVAPVAMVDAAPHGDTGEHPCTGMDLAPATSQANACEVHCTDGVTLPASPDLPPVVLMALPMPAMPVATLAAAEIGAKTPYAALPGAPPLTLQFCRLLI